MQIKTISDFRRAIRNGPYAWPGGYPLYFVCADGEAMSFAAVKSELRNVLCALVTPDLSGWRVIGMDVNWEDPALYCAHTGERIESAYAEDDAAPPAVVPLA